VKFGTPACQISPRAACRPCGAKNPKIGPWVKTIPAELPFGQILPVIIIIIIIISVM